MSKHFTDGLMEPVSKSLLKTLKELHQLPSLSELTLGGGTNLALRYGHRLSDDIDLFYPGVLGQQKFDEILDQIGSLYKGNIIWSGYPTHLDEQMMFGRVHIRDKRSMVKIEILQNSHTYDPPDIEKGFRLMSERDIGLLKLVTAGNRANYKDIYDLDYITDRIPLNQLMSDLKIKLAKYREPHHLSVFHLQHGNNNPIDNPDCLLKFENPTKQKADKPGHSSLRLDIIEGNKNWNVARSSWRSKVRSYFREIGQAFPQVTPVNDQPDLEIGANDEDIDYGLSR